ncbi:OmpA/MotB family protein [Kushneria aurantia]|uniref:Flagellar motor protein MotB n=1 Tax=Kushneria aurantia TaxID=504092 RepID=A0ABV6G037_9GAMM|nr:OmpA family protein [Kushneria aurantia]
MLDHETERVLEPSTDAGEAEEGWLTSYLDMLTLLITFFVLLLTLIPQGSGEADDNRRVGLASDASSLAQRASGLQPAHQGLHPRFSGLKMQGVSVLTGREGITLRIDNSLLFGSGEASLTTRGQEVIASLTDQLASFDGQISVEGHTDNVPIDTLRFPSNWALSSARAIAVVRYLQSMGIAPSRMRAVGYADTRPVESNDTPEGRAANRRVEILLRQQVAE